MFNRQFNVILLNTKDSFLYFSDSDSKYLKPGTAIKFEYGDRNHYGTVGIGSINRTLKPGEMGISSCYSNIINLSDTNVVSISTLNTVLSVQSCTLIPDSPGDYEILETISDEIQNLLLNQLTVISNGQKCIIWITNSNYITTTFDNIIPKSPGRLENLTEVVILQTYNNRSILSSTDITKISNKDNKLDKYNLTYNELLFRMLDFNSIYNIDYSVVDKKYVSSISTIFVKNSFLSCLKKQNTISTLQLFRLHFNNILSSNNEFPPRSFKESIIVRVISLDDINVCCQDFQLNDPVAYVNLLIKANNHMDIKSHFVLEQLNETLPSKYIIEIHTNNVNISNCVKMFKQFIVEQCKNNQYCILNADVQYKISNNYILKVRFIDSSFCVITNETLTKYTFTTKEHNESVYTVDAIENHTNITNVIYKIYETCQIGLRKSTRNLESTLIIGKSGTGKSNLISSINKIFKKNFMQLHIESICCKTIKGKTIDSLHKIFLTVFQRLIYFQPSILILDDLHVICKNISDEANAAEDNYFIKITNMLKDFFQKYVNNNNIMVVATCESIFELNKYIFTSKGKRFFKNVIYIPALTKKDRYELIQHEIEKDLLLDKDVDISKLAAMVDGFMVQDILDLLEKITFEAIKGGSKYIKMDHCIKAFDKFCPLTIREVELNSAGNRDFTDIGGLDDVKKVIMETIFWPVKYPAIFDLSPLRMQSGILLYGPPGTGKTILAAATARQCGLKFICVNGPELLSKYIGSSEQSVRDIFEKAQSAKPCILFFDEFDSLAPRRGHDSTGVTDRVVNQLLTQLDGIEDLCGVFVFAATSRPDLLDPALLRPGRLDRQLYCPLPNKKERLSILLSLSKGMLISHDVNFEVIADLTERYSGADLQSILYSAQISSFDISGEYNVSETELQITHAQLYDAVLSSRPTLNEKEIYRYQEIYSVFQRDKKQKLSDSSLKQHATLA